MLKNMLYVPLLLMVIFFGTVRDVPGQKRIGVVSFSDDSLQVMEEFNRGKSILLYNRAIASINSGDYRVAISQLGESSVLAGGMADALYNRAVANLGMNNPVEAMLDIAEAIQLDPRPEYYISRSLLFLHRTDTTAALSDIQKAVGAGKDDIDILLIAGMIYLKTNDYAAARESFGKVYNMAPSNTRAINGLVATALAEGDTASAIANLKLSVGVDPDQISLFYVLGDLLHYRKQFVESYGVFERINEKKPDDVKVLNTIAVLYLKRGMPDSAMVWCDRAIAVDSMYSRAWNTRGNIEYKLENLAGAEADYTMAALLDPGFYAAYYNRGLVRIRLRDDSGACEDLKLAASHGIPEAEFSYKESCE